MSVIAFLALSIIPGLNLNSITAWSQLHRLNDILRTLPTNLLKENSGSNQILSNANSALALVLKVKSPTEVKSKIQTMFPMLSSVEVENLYKSILDSNPSKFNFLSPADYKNRAIYTVTNNFLPIKIGTFTNLVQFNRNSHTVVLVGSPIVFEINQAKAMIRIGTKSDGFKDYDFTKIVTKNLVEPIVFTDAIGKLKYQLIITDAFICNNCQNHLEGELLYSY